MEAIAIYHDKVNYEVYEMKILVTQDNGNRPEIKITGNQTKFQFDISKEEPKNLDYFKNIISIYDEEDGPIELNSEKVSIQTDWDGSWLKEGTYYITIIVTDSDNNTSEVVVILSLVDSTSDPIDITHGYDVTIEDSDLYYTGDIQRPSVTVKNNEGHTLVEDFDYEII